MFPDLSGAATQPCKAGLPGVTVTLSEHNGVPQPPMGFRACPTGWSAALQAVTLGFDSLQVHFFLSPDLAMSDSYSYDRGKKAAEESDGSLVEAVKKVGWRCQNAVAAVETVERKLKRNAPDSDLLLQVGGVEKELKQALEYLEQVKKLLKK